MNKNTDYLLNLINQLLDFRKTEESEYQLYIKLYSINDLLKDAYERFKNAIELKDLAFTISMPESDLKSGVDKDAITQKKKAFLNLINEEPELFYDLLNASMLLKKEMYQEYINLNTLNRKNLKDSADLILSNDRFELLAKREHTFEELKSTTENKEIIVFDKEIGGFITKCNF
jgi:hypothetical protein